MRARVGLWLLVPVGVVVAARFACTSAPTPTWTGDDLSEAGAGAPLQLDRMPATWTLSTDTSELDLAARTTWTLDSWIASTGRTEGEGEEHEGNALEISEPVWSRVPLPFHVPPPERRFAPDGMRLVVDGLDAVFFAGSTRPPGRRLWRFRGTFLEVSGPPPVTASLEHPKLLEPLKALEWTLARDRGITEDAFVRRNVAITDQSREGLLLPAPAEARWEDVTLPEGARFTSVVGFAPTPLPSRSDGAEVVLILSTSGGDLELGRGSVPRGERFTPFELDLSAHAGKTGALIVRTLPGGTAADDYVFIGSPVIAPTGHDDAVRRVIVIGVDTLRPDHLGMYGYPQATSTDLDAWAQDAVVFDQAWASAPRTRPSFRASTTGRNPLEAVCAKNIGAVFDEAGFATGGIVANVHLNPRFDFHEGFDLWQLDGEAKVEDQVERARQWIDSNRHRDSYLFLHIMDPHVFYVAPPAFTTPFTSLLPALNKEEQVPRVFNRANVYRWMQRGKLNDLQRQHIVARYDGEVSYTTHHIAKLLEWVDTLPGRTVVVIHSDHGEEFWEHGGFEHNHTLYDETTKAVLVIKPPGGSGSQGARSLAPATLTDIGATLFDLAGLTDLPPLDGQSLVPALRGEAFDPDRALPIGYLQYEAERWGVMWKHHKYVVHTGTGEQELYDLAADPGETRNLADTVDTSPWWKQVAATHRIQVGQGWRIPMDLADCDEVVLQLPVPAKAAGILDPESITHTPVNQEWGEVPRLFANEVGEAHLSEDGRTVTIVGGPRAHGTVYVLFGDESVSYEGTQVLVNGEAVAIERAGALRVGTSTLTLQPGVVVIPPASEVERMAQCLEMGQGSTAELAELAALGYIDAKAPEHISRPSPRSPVLPSAQRCAAAAPE